MITNSNAIFKDSLNAAIVEHAKSNGVDTASRKLLHLVYSGSTFLVKSKVIFDELSVSLSKKSWREIKETVAPDLSREQFVEDLNAFPLVQLDAPNYEQQIYSHVVGKLLGSESAPFRFHGIEANKHYFLVCRINAAAEKVFKFKNEIYSHEEAQKTFPNCPESKAQFIKDVKKHPELIIEQPVAELLSPRETPCDVFYEQYGFIYKFSRELQSNLRGERGNDHTIALETLKMCIKKSHKKIRKAILTTNERQRFDLNFLEEKSGKILNVVIQFSPSKNKVLSPNLSVLTAYYPTRNVLFDRNKFSQVAYENWVRNLPKV
ncbi:MAG: hypothetical protein COT85_00125 [Chlamydiae bacterium CG10_big_fil_rev_8_21_14_0_10_42_34]|nr:MAG: hypothetical protein COT85_00125 [Chlamydiae bacterium CG10_big_fil_rev_8_21_14_0_10_42_34]